MTKALIATAFNDNPIITERYVGDQSIDELKEVLPTYQSSVRIRNMVGKGTLSHIAPDNANRSIEFAADESIRKHPRVAMQNLNDYVRLLNESVRAVKEDRLKENIKNARNDAAKASYRNAFEEDDWRPDALFLVSYGKGNWSGHMIWQMWDGEQWADLNPDVIMLQEHPELASKYFHKVESTETGGRKTKQKGRKAKASEHHADMLLEDIEETTDDRELSSEDAHYAQMLDKIGSDTDEIGYDYEN